MYPPEVGYLGSHGLCYPLRYMDYATQSSRVGARVPYSLLKVLLCAAIYYHSVVGPPGIASWCALGTLLVTS